MPVLSARASCLATSAMEGINVGGPVHPGDMVWHKVKSLMRSAEEGGRDPEFTQPVSETGKSRPCYCITIAQVLRTEAAPAACVRLQLANPAMQRERQRMCSRRGGTRGRASTQRQGHISPSSSIEVTSVPQRFQGSNDEGGRGAGRDARAEGGQEESPTLRYRLPCPQANSTLIISITVEPGATQDEAIHVADYPVHGAEPIPEWQRQSREESPIACHPVRAGTSHLVHGRGSGIDLERPAKECVPSACPMALAGPSKPVQEGPSGAVIPLSDSDDSLLFGCRVEEAPYTTDEE